MNQSSDILKSILVGEKEPYFSYDDFVDAIPFLDELLSSSISFFQGNRNIAKLLSLTNELLEIIRRRNSSLTNERIIELLSLDTYELIFALFWYINSDVEKEVIKKSLLLIDFIHNSLYVRVNQSMKKIDTSKLKKAYENHLILFRKKLVPLYYNTFFKLQEKYINLNVELNSILFKNWVHGALKDAYPNILAEKNEECKNEENIIDSLSSIRDTTESGKVLETIQLINNYIICINLRILIAREFVDTWNKFYRKYEFQTVHILPRSVVDGIKDIIINKFVEREENSIYGHIIRIKKFCTNISPLIDRSLVLIYTSKRGKNISKIDFIIREIYEDVKSTIMKIIELIEESRLTTIANYQCSEVLNKLTDFVEN